MISEKQILANRANALKSTGPRTPEGKAISSQNAVTHGLLSKRVVVHGEDRFQFESFRNELFEQLDPVGILENRLADQIVANFWRLRRAGHVEVDLINSVVECFRKQAEERQKRYLYDAYDRFIRVAGPVFPFDDFEQTCDAWYQTGEGRRWYKKVGSRDDIGHAMIQEFAEFLSRSVEKAIAEAKTSEQTDVEIIDQNVNDTEVPASACAGPEQQQDQTEQSEISLALAEDFRGQNLIFRFSRYEGQIERGLYRALTELQKLKFLRKRNEAIFVAPQENEPAGECHLHP